MENGEGQETEHGRLRGASQHDGCRQDTNRSQPYAQPASAPEGRGGAHGRPEGVTAARPAFERFETFLDALDADAAYPEFERYLLAARQTGPGARVPGAIARSKRTWTCSRA